jgi:ABC-type Fe3+/spermidine/putrescine transport system ATPase subunit
VLRIEGLHAAAGTFRLQGVDLAVPESSYTVLLGPPGSGKSVLIETICGLRRAAAGRVFLDGADITGLEPRDRQIGYVPQDYALFPTKRVAANITFGLRARGIPREEARRQTQSLVEMLDLSHLLDRWPGTLSGGEQQRVALARALATRPRLLLLDEPVSALDEGSRESVCRELRRIQRELGVTTLHISHNLEEAFSVADLAAIMCDGRIVQTGPLEALLRRPRTAFVARFLRAENVFNGQADGHAVRIGPLELAMSQQRSGQISVMVRPENIGLTADPGSRSADATLVPGQIERCVDRGPYVRVDFDGPMPLVVHASHRAVADLPAQPGATVFASIRAEDVHVLQEDD